jgi:hypothetical protein
VDQTPPEVTRLGDQLMRALQLSEADGANWRQALVPLFTQSAAGSWRQERRFLYDLERVCFDSEHGVWTVDLVEWAMSMGQLPIKRQLPGHHEVAIVRHLRQALDRLRLIRLSESERQQLHRLLSDALAKRERLMRERFRPLLVTAFDEVGLTPRNVCEDIGRAKLIEELLDRVVEFGHLNIGNLRDAISRNQMKLPDLSGPGELITGDPLIRLNRKLAVALDGVYRRGEFYMRLLHRFSSLGFGTTLGRLLVLFLILPFGLAFFTLITPGIAVEEVEKLGRWIGLVEPPPKQAIVPPPVDDGEWEWDEDEEDWFLVEPAARQEPRPPERRPATTHEFPMPNSWSVAGLGVFFLLLFNVRGFRSYVFYGLGKFGRALQLAMIDTPVWLVSLPTIQAILRNRLWSVFRRLVFWPLAAAALGGSLALWNALDLNTSAGVAFGFLVGGFVLVNTRLGREVEETITDWLLGFWVWVTIDLVPGLLRLIMDLSRRLLDAVEHMLYTVNEWLRFRSGENQVTIVIKAIVGLFWFCVTYVIRFAVNLLIEPQVNPIKHFPVVTVSHKICLPLIPTLANVLENTLNLSRPRTTATGIIFGIPGIFGFMVWELKENWRLYSSNRAANLKPVLIGSHGETMYRLLHPGFHSGTVPKLFQRLRRAERRGRLQTVRKLKDALHHVAESVERFVEHELVAFLQRAKRWSNLPVELGHVRLGTNRVLVELRCSALGENPLVFSVDYQDGWLLAGVLEPGWLPSLNEEQRQTLAAGLAGLYKLAGVHLTREQIDASLPPPTLAYTLTAKGLVAWACDGNQDVTYDLRPEGLTEPIRLSDGSLATDMPVLDTKRLLFSNVTITWDQWVRICAGDQTDGDFAAALWPRTLESEPPA